MFPMSDPAPMARFGGDAPDPDGNDERPALLRFLKRARALIVLVPLVVGLLVAASIGASKLWAELPERVAPPPDVTCWNGSTAPLTECPPPTGKGGLRWVFPSFRAQDAQCREIRRPASDRARPVEFTCDLRLDQRPVTVVYSVRTSVTQGLAFLERSYGSDPAADGELLVFRDRRPDDEGSYRLTAAYAEHPYSVTVQAPEPGLRDTALAELVEFRPAERLLARG